MPTFEKSIYNVKSARYADVEDMKKFILDCDNGDVLVLGLGATDVEFCQAVKSGDEISTVTKNGNYFDKIMSLFYRGRQVFPIRP